MRSEIARSRPPGDREIVATGEPPNWGGCLVWVSFDGASYTNVGEIFVGGRQGVLTAVLPSVVDPDTTSTLAVDLTECQGQLLTAGQAETELVIGWQTLAIVLHANARRGRVLAQGVTAGILLPQEEM